MTRAVWAQQLFQVFLNFISVLDQNSYRISPLQRITGKHYISGNRDAQECFLDLVKKDLSCCIIWCIAAEHGTTSWLMAVRGRENFFPILSPQAGIPMDVCSKRASKMQFRFRSLKLFLTLGLKMSYRVKRWARKERWDKGGNGSSRVPQIFSVYACLFTWKHRTQSSSESTFYLKLKIHFLRHYRRRDLMGLLRWRSWWNQCFDTKMERNSCCRNGERASSTKSEWRGWKGSSLGTVVMCRCTLKKRI